MLGSSKLRELCEEPAVKFEQHRMILRIFTVFKHLVPVCHMLLKHSVKLFAIALFTLRGSSAVCMSNP
eukprot:SAG31_NODE_32853_length_351_cov_0.571429_1_plen_68_part_00